MKRIQVVVYGSCVARDTFHHLPADRYHLQRYIARQSLISAFSKQTIIPASVLDTLSSDFQRRTLGDDFESSLPRDLELYGAESQIVLWDLTDERLGVFEMGDNRFITNSIELAASASHHSIFQQNRLIPFSSREHFDLWTTALPAFKKALTSNAPQAKLLLIAPNWADPNGEGIRERIFRRGSQHVANQKIKKYVRAAQMILEPQATISCRAVADPRNRWGPAPYHYDRETYQKLAARIEKIATHNS